MAEDSTITVGDRQFRVKPMTLSVHRALAPLRTEMSAANVQDAQLLMDLDDQQRRLREVVSKDGEVDRAAVDEVAAAVARLNGERDTIVDRITSLQLRCVIACLAPVDGELPEESWWEDHYDLRDLPEHFADFGLVRPTNLTPD